MRTWLPKSMIVFACAIAGLMAGIARAQDAPLTAEISGCGFANGVSIAPCKIAYRTFGTLNAARDNVVLIPTVILGRSEDWAPFLGPGGIVDSSKYYVIVVDALADGQSQSPSNTAAAGRRGFEALTIGDMVESQYRLLTEKLGITSVRAVVGYSMGGLQALEWAVRYPQFAAKVVSMAGSPRFGAYDRLLWTAMKATIDDGLRGSLPPDVIWLQLTRVDALHARTPRGVNESPPETVEQDVAASAANYSKTWALEDYRAQIGAVLRHDVSAAYGGDLAKAGSRIRAKILIMYSWDDHMVTADEVSAFAKLIGAETAEISSPCGHYWAVCETGKVGARVGEFLAR
jgi:homoserine O-acetyltransferase/O-succinyltransferase